LGHAIYFAPNCDVASQHCKCSARYKRSHDENFIVNVDDSSHTFHSKKCLLLCRVFLGRVYQCSSHNTNLLHRATKAPDNTDSVTAPILTSGRAADVMYAVYKNHQCLPLYLLHLDN
jgi:hypothetical protein